MILQFEVIETERGKSIYFKTTGKEKPIYEQRVLLNEGEIIIDNCTCAFGSVYRFSKNLKGKDVKCKHIKEAIALLKHIGYIK
jgi:hypothetical protein